MTTLQFLLLWLILLRLLGHSSEMNAAGILNVNVDGREVAITCIHVGVNLPRVQQALTAPQFEAEVNRWRRQFSNKTIVGGPSVAHDLICLLSQLYHCFNFVFHYPPPLFTFAWHPMITQTFITFTPNPLFYSTFVMPFILHGYPILSFPSVGFCFNLCHLHSRYWPVGASEGHPTQAHCYWTVFRRRAKLERKTYIQYDR